MTFPAPKNADRQALLKQMSCVHALHRTCVGGSFGHTQTTHDQRNACTSLISGRLHLFSPVLCLSIHKRCTCVAALSGRAFLPPGCAEKLVTPSTFLPPISCRFLMPVYCISSRLRLTGVSAHLVGSGVDGPGHEHAEERRVIQRRRVVRHLPEGAHRTERPAFVNVNTQAHRDPSELAHIHTHIQVRKVLNRA